MIQKSIYDKYYLIMNMLSDMALNQALSLIEDFIQDTSDWELHTELEDIKTTYHYMLEYFLQNKEDPHRMTLFNELIRRTYQLNDKALFSVGKQVSNSYYFVCQKYQDKNPRTMADYQRLLESYTEDIAMASLLNEGEKQQEKLQEIRTRHENTYAEFFKKVWTSPMWNTEMRQEATQILNSVMMPVNDVALLVSAVTVGAMQLFDLQKYLFLMDACNHPETLVNQRALVGMVLVGMHYDKRLQVEPEVKARIQLMKEDNNLLRNLTDIQIQLLRTKETEKVEKKMREEIIPEVIKQTDFLQQSKLGLDEDEMQANDLNPEWKGWAENSKLADKLKELGDMQLEGVDVYLSTFSQLKTFPFFREISNWFYPFDPDHSAVLKSFPGKNGNHIATGILGTQFFCNSDKYSLCFTLAEATSKHQNFFGFNLDDIDLKAEGLSIPDNGTPPDREIVSRQYIQDLYRFYKLHPHHHEFFNIFGSLLIMNTYATLNELANQLYQRTLISEYLFEKGYYLPAALQYEKILKRPDNPDDAETYQKLGYCFQKLRRYNEAIGYYLQADIRQPDNVWTNRHLAQCYRLEKEKDKAVSYYEKVEAACPDDLKLLLTLGECYVEQQRYDEAFTRFFKAEYLNSDPQQAPKIERAIAWCSFISGKLEQAKKYYERVLNQPLSHAMDRMNAGHVAWCMGDLQSAISYYRASYQRLKMSMKEADIESFIIILSRDEGELMRYGISKDEIALMYDALRFLNLH